MDLGPIYAKNPFSSLTQMIVSHRKCHNRLFVFGASDEMSLMSTIKESNMLFTVMLAAQMMIEMKNAKFIPHPRSLYGRVSSFLLRFMRTQPRGIVSIHVAILIFPVTQE